MMRWGWLADGTARGPRATLTSIGSLRQSLPNIRFAFILDQTSDFAVGGGIHLAVVVIKREAEGARLSQISRHKEGYTPC